MIYKKASKKKLLYDTENKEELFFDVYALGEKVSLDYDIGHK